MKQELFKRTLGQLNSQIQEYDQEYPHADPEQRELFARSKADEILVAESPDLSAGDITTLCDRLIDHALGMGDLQPLMEDPDISNIEINGWDNIFVHRRSAPGFSRWNGTIGESDEDLIQLIRTISVTGKNTREQPWTNSDWRINFRLPDGSRLHGVQAVSAFPSITIRKHDYSLSHLSNLVQIGAMPNEVARFLAALVQAKANIVVSGGTNSGKTTLLRALLNVVPPTERIITAEDIPELAVGRDAERHPNTIEMVSLVPNQDGYGGATLTEIMRETLRMNPDRVVVGEIRGAEITQMVRAMTQGNDGSMCSIHADNAIKAVSRLVRYYEEGGHSRENAHTAIGDAVDFIVHLGFRNDRRVVRQVVEVCEAEVSGKVPPLVNPILDDEGNVWRVGGMRDEWWRRLELVGFMREWLSVLQGSSAVEA